MRRMIFAAALIALLVGAGGTVAGCGSVAKAAGATTRAAASASPAPWAKLVGVGGSLNGPQRGRMGVTVEVAGSALRIDITYGPAPGWGADRALLRWWPLGHESDGNRPLPTVPLRVVSKTYWRHNDSTTIRLETTSPLSPGTYAFAYQGSGWYDMTVYQQ